MISQTMPAILALKLGRLPTAVDIDHLAARFLHLEEKVDRAYKIAMQWDEPHEKLKDELIDLLTEFGTIHANLGRVLEGETYQLSADGVPPILCVRRIRK
jgi:hypothetical protein